MAIDVYQPYFGGDKSAFKRGNQLYRPLLREQLRGVGAEDYRATTRAGLADREMAGRAAARRTVAGGFGMNNPTGLSAALDSDIALQTPYGEAELAARELAARRTIQAGSALEASKQAQANMYATLIGPILQAAALQQAAAAGGGTTGDLLGGIGGLLGGSGDLIGAF